MSADPKDADRPGIAGLRSAWLLLVCVTAACLTPFVDKAFHIDDHRYLGIARQVVQDPLDYYGFDVNFGNAEQPFAPLANNPPLIGFYTAAMASVVGWSEPALHGAFALLAIAGVLAVWSVARRLCRDPTLAALLCLSFPAYLLSATTVMAVVGMLACFCAAVACWQRGLSEQKLGWLVLGACMATLSALTKYFGLALVPLLLVYGAFRERAIGRWALPLGLTLVALLLYELHTASVYGVSPILASMGYAVTTRPDTTPPLSRIVVALVFSGGVLAPVLAFAAFGFTRVMLAVTLGLGTALFGAWSLERAASGAEPDVNLWLHGFVFALAGAALPVLVASDWLRRRDADSLLLALWAVGGFVFAAIVNYTTNGRSVLPMAPPIAILAVRQLEARGRMQGGWRYALLVPGFLLSLGVAAGDQALADASRTAARAFSDRYAALGGTLFSETSWGFQHYMTEGGARRMDVRHDWMRPGDHLARPLNWTGLLAPPGRGATRVETLAIPLPVVTTMLRASDTGFYAIQWGALPYRIQAGHRAEFEVLRAEEWLIFEDDPKRAQERLQSLDRAHDLVAVVLAAPPDALGPDCTPAFAAVRATARSGCRTCSTPEACLACFERGLSQVDCGSRLRAYAEAEGERCARELRAGEAALGEACQRMLRERARWMAPPAD